MQRLQGSEWHLMKNSLKLISNSISYNGNIRGIYTDGKNKYSHWLNDKEKEEYFKQDNKFNKG